MVQKTFAEILAVRRPKYEHTRTKMPVGVVMNIQNVEFYPSQFGDEYAVVTAEMQAEVVEFSVSSHVVVEQLKTFELEMPFSATIVMRKSEAGRDYYTLE